MLQRCPNCTAETWLLRPMERTRHVAGISFTASLPAQVCASCKEAYFRDEDVALFDARVATILADAGIVAPEALRFLRKVTGLQAKELAALLSVRPETVSRWEQGKAPIDRATYALLRQIQKDHLEGSTATATYLRSLKKPRRLPKKVRVDLSGAA